jgi:SanA protein
MKPLIRFLKYFILVVVVIAISFIAWVNYTVDKETSNQLYSDVHKIPKNKVGLLLGTAKFRDKARNIVNPFYQNRIDAAVALYMAGKIDYIVVSGDNSNLYYNEPLLMRDDLIARGIPARRIYLDNAGYRTLDSILRCRDIFGQNSFTIISQEWHNERALYIANHKNVKAVAFNAAEGDSYWDATLRERLARVKMMGDIVFNKQARYYGDPIEIK